MTIYLINGILLSSRRKADLLVKKIKIVVDIPLYFWYN